MDAIISMAPVLVIVACLLLPFVVGPILIRITLTQSAEPQVIPFPLDHPSLPRELAHDFQVVVNTLQSRGFESVTGLALPRQSPNVKAVLLLLANRQTRELALATAMFAETPQGPQRQVFYVEFVTRFREGTVVLTQNAKVLGVFAPRPGFIINRFPMVNDAGQLYRLHQGMLARLGSALRAFRLDEEFGGDAAAYVEASIREELESQLPTGYLYLSPRAKVYRATYKGACLMTWKLLWPISAIRRAIVARKAHRLMAEFKAEADERGS